MNLDKITNLCKEFNVKFAIEVDSDSMTLYKFGEKVTWMKAFGYLFDEDDFYRVSMRLAATYPEIIIGFKNETK